MEPIYKPPCADWNVWLGREVEGETDIGEMTLFIRKLSPHRTVSEYVEQFKGKVHRVWFCKEFRDWKALAYMSQYFPKVCLEVCRENYSSIPKEIFVRCVLYYKLPVVLKKGDYVCVGPEFADESFRLGKGNEVVQQKYCRDERVE